MTEAIARGLQAGGLPEPDLCPLPADARRTRGLRAKALLDALDFDARMRSARAVIVCAVERLSEQTLAASVDV